jgi:hypothetical protein
MIPLHPQDWARIVGDDLVEFIGLGGALVRFVVAETSHEATLIREVLRERTAEEDLHFFEVNGACSRLHFANDLLAAVAEQLDLRTVITSFLHAALADTRYSTPADTSPFSLHNIARTNDVEPADIAPILNQRIRARIIEDKRLVRDLRFALWAMATEVMQGKQASAATDVTARWLTGDSLRIKELREFGIVQKIDRYNARSVLRSLFTWLPASGSRGSIVYVDAICLANARRGRRSDIFYSRPALADAYEVMREFIDDTDEMHNVMIVFNMAEEFLSVDPSGRGMGAYQALQQRVTSFAEATLPNPLANLVLLSADADRRRFSTR